eukprot:TRINITY_DN4679_c0_g1_i3.p1 TRINITY_DN4679_c0_g1~~TRINITY_DN4679_c0_g1_i3.p1  ORF type:complete len:119 (-),score=25.42 TRINITY_DN4679_c0_g1_i3:5-361(-)
MITPKANGAVTPLAFMSAFFVLRPDYMIRGNRMLPFFVVPFIYVLNEYNEHRLGVINEISRYAHFSAIANGALFGLVMKLVFKMQKCMRIRVFYMENSLIPKSIFLVCCIHAKSFVAR